MSDKKVVITGASSFTGVWITRGFHLAGWSVHGLCSQSEDVYTGLVKERVRCLKALGDVHFNIKAERDDFIPVIKKLKPDIWVHHHHYMKDFRSPIYDYNHALQLGIQPLPSLIHGLKENNIKGVIYSGSYFEPKESGYSMPYGESKAIVGDELTSLCFQYKIPFSKIIIPDPVGPLENDDRFIPQVLKYAREKKIFTLTEPNKNSDHIPVHLLARSYVEVAKDLLEKKESTLRPTGWIGSSEEWLKEIQISLLEKMNLKLKIEIGRSGDNLPSRDHTKINLSEFWNNYLNWIKTGQPWSSNHN